MKFFLPEEWTKTEGNQSFLLLQESGILLFVTDQGLEFLSRSECVLADGTFKTAPKPFMQIYTFFGTAENRKIPVAWAFLGNKTKRS